MFSAKFKHTRMVMGTRFGYSIGLTISTSIASWSLSVRLCEVSILLPL
jgi:hypothetical protein